MVIFPILATTNHLDGIFYEEYKSGALDFLLVSHETLHIVFSKLGTLFLIIFVTILSHYFAGIIFFKINISDMKKLLFAGIYISALAASIITVAGAMRVYFEKNNNILAISALQLLIPELVICGLYFHNPLSVYLYLLSGIAFVLIPLSIFLINILLKEIYNS